MNLALSLLLAATLFSSTCQAIDPPKTKLGRRNQQFLINGRPVFLLGISYYGGLGASPKNLQGDLDEMQKAGFNWIRVWANWSAYGHDVAAVDAHGKSRPVYLRKLQTLVEECDRRGMIVDITLTRGNGVTGPPRLQTLEDHERAVRTLVKALGKYNNWYLDLSNERNIQDKRFASFADLRDLRALVRKLDKGLLVTASHGGDIGREDLAQYLKVARVDFLCPHRPRSSNSPGQTFKETKTLKEWMKKIGIEVPIHFQEPFRRGYADYQPSVGDFLRDLQGAKRAGAAGWCFHNGGQRNKKDEKPRRSFDLTEVGLFAQLDAVERDLIRELRKLTDRQNK